MSIFLVLAVLAVVVFINDKYDSDNYIERDMWEMFLEAEKKSQMSMEELLSDEINDDVISDVWLRLCELSDYGYELNFLNKYQKNYWLVYNYIGEVGNGGIEQFFYNCHEFVAPTLESLKELGLTHSYQYLKAAADIYPQYIVEMYSNEKLSNQLDDIDSTYYDDAEEECYTFFEEYLQKYKEKLVKK